MTLSSFSMVMTGLGEGIRCRDWRSESHLRLSDRSAQLEATRGQDGWRRHGSRPWSERHPKGQQPPEAACPIASCKSLTRTLILAITVRGESPQIYSLAQCSPLVLHLPRHMIYQQLTAYGGSDLLDRRMAELVDAADEKSRGIPDP